MCSIASVPYLKNSEIQIFFCTKYTNLDTKFMLKQNKMKPNQNKQWCGTAQTYLKVATVLQAGFHAISLGPYTGFQ